ncbi:helix-turn-helix domain-containing protein [Sulfurimonas sp. SAG-AH-194-C20]|nr:helix-turn-helix domain-containing protein [Sulfurimonas sp. SAG-AH-194-C20]MDF1878923.1 helix-turn-helix domain-containing protein [Sulfurimonas sp. SAG-AH-194-C20]
MSLKILFSNISRTFSVDEFIYELWYDTDNSRIAVLKPLMKGLRKKLPEGTIKNIFVVGYTFRDINQYISTNN